MQPRQLFFISKHARWQTYRQEVFAALAETYAVSVTVLTVQPIAEQIDQASSVRYLGFRSWLPLESNPGFFPGAVWHLIRNRPDVVLSQNDTLQFTEYLAWLWCKIARIDFVWWTHGHMPSVVYSRRWVRRLRQAYALFFLKRSRKAITYCQTGMRYLRRYGVQADRLTVAPNTLDTRKLARLQREFRTRSRARLLPAQAIDAANGFCVLYVGRLAPRKRLEDLLAAMRILQEEDLPVHLLIAGDGEMRDELTQVANDLSLGNVIFLGAVYEDSALARLCCSADVMVIPGAVGLAAVLGMQYGLPVITRRMRHHGPEIGYLRHGSNGFILQEGKGENFAAAIRQLATDPDLLEKMSVSALTTAQQEAGIELMLQRMADALRLTSRPG